MSDPYNAPPPGYGQQPYSHNPMQAQGQQLAQTSMILGILSLFVVGFVLGPLAISKAKKAEAMGADANVGKITGWIGLVLGILGFILVAIYVIGLIAFVGGMDY